MLVPNRHGNSSNYRYGFNGKEKDDELKGEGNSLDYEKRFYDSRIGKFLSIDPLFKGYPWYTPYQFAGNTPIQAIDLDGLEEMIMIREKYMSLVLRRYIIKVPTAEKRKDIKPVGTVAVLNVNSNRIESMKGKLSSDDGRKTLISQSYNEFKIQDYTNPPEDNFIKQTDSEILAKTNISNQQPVSVQEVNQVNIPFDTDKSNLTDISPVVDKAFKDTKALVDATGATITIYGTSSGTPTRYVGTDSGGNTRKGELNVENNNILSNDRAHSVKNFLIKNYGFTENQIIIGKPKVADKSDSEIINKSNQKASISVNLTGDSFKTIENGK